MWAHCSVSLPFQLRRCTAKILSAHVSCAVLSEPIALLINRSFSTGTFPSLLKKAQIAPVFKSGDQKTVSNYLPISVLPTLSKIYERCMHTRLVSHLSRHNILFPCQFGFWKHCSTVQAVNKFTEFLYDSLNRKHFAISLFIDLRRAFDTVNHSILLAKLKAYWVRGLALDWFSSYLYDKEYCVRIGDSVSQYVKSKVSIPQGSILGTHFIYCLH